MEKGKKKGKRGEDVYESLLYCVLSMVYVNARSNCTLSVVVRSRSHFIIQTRGPEERKGKGKSRTHEKYKHNNKDDDDGD